MLGVVAGVAALAVAWYFLKRPTAAEEPGEALERDAEELSRSIREGGRDRTAESALEGALAFGAVGFAIFGPPGLVLVGLGAFVGALGQAINHESYGRRVRIALQDWLKANKAPHGSREIDAVVYRMALRHSKHVWVHRRTGDVATEVLRLVEGDVHTSLMGGRVNDTLAGYAVVQAQQAIERRAPGQLDGPDQRRRHREWRAAARVGELYKIEATPARTSWVTPGYVYFKSVWPLMALTPTRRTEDWVKTEVTPDNVDEIAARFDRAAGIVR